MLILSFFHSGGVIVILDPSMTFDRIDHCISTAKPTFFVYPKGSLLRFLKVLYVIFSPVESQTVSTDLNKHFRVVLIKDSL